MPKRNNQKSTKKQKMSPNNQSQTQYEIGDFNSKQGKITEQNQPYSQNTDKQPTGVNNTHNPSNQTNYEIGQMGKTRKSPKQPEKK